MPKNVHPNGSKKCTSPNGSQMAPTYISQFTLNIIETLNKIWYNIFINLRGETNEKKFYLDINSYFMYIFN